MKSTEVYKIINSIISSDLKDRGYKKTKSGMLGFNKKIEDEFLVFWFQISRDGFDEYSGSKFIIEFSARSDSEIGHGGREGGRIAKYLAKEQLTEILKLQNKVIKKLKKPPKDYPVLQISEDVRKWYRGKFEVIKDEYKQNSDIWFRYHDVDDVKMWIDYLRFYILKILENIEEKFNEEIRPTTAST